MHRSVGDRGPDAFASRACAAEIRQDERLSCARELHDRLGQQTVSLALLLGRLEPFVQSVEGQTHLARLTRQIDALNDEFRRLLRDLHEPATVEGDLQDMLAALVGRWRDTAGIEVEFCTQGAHQAVTTDEQFAVLRVVQEALTNIVKHAPAADRVVVTLTFSTHHVVVSIADNGPGFVLERTCARSGSDRRYGLAGMGDRLRRLGGVLTIQAAPGRGVTVHGRVPLTPAGT